MCDKSLDFPGKIYKYLNFMRWVCECVKNHQEKETFEKLPKL